MVISQTQPAPAPRARLDRRQQRRPDTLPPSRRVEANQFAASGVELEGGRADPRRAVPGDRRVEVGQPVQPPLVAIVWPPHSARQGSANQARSASATGAMRSDPRTSSVIHRPHRCSAYSSPRTRYRRAVGENSRVTVRGGLAVCPPAGGAAVISAPARSRDWAREGSRGRWARTEGGRGRRARARHGAGGEWGDLGSGAGWVDYPPDRSTGPFSPARHSIEAVEGGSFRENAVLAAGRARARGGVCAPGYRSDPAAIAA